MNLHLVAEILVALGRRSPRAPFALLRAMPPGLLRALGAPGLRETFRVATRASYYRDAFAAARVDVARARRPEDFGDFYLTPEVLKTRPEALVAGTPELAIESSGTSGHATGVYLSRRELEYNARQGGLLYGLYGLGRGDRLLCTLDLAWGLGSLLVERGVRYTPLFAMVVGRVDPLEAYRRLAEYRFNVLVSDPFWLARLTAIARERGRPGPMKLLMGGGEGITERTRAELEKYWGAPLCMTYASTEAATILAFECTHRRGYHVNEFDFYVEITDADGDGYGAARERAVQEVLGALQRTQPDAWLAYCQRLLDVEFAFFAPGTLRQQRKLLRLVDERQSGPPEWVKRAVAYGRT